MVTAVDQIRAIWDRVPDSQAVYQRYMRELDHAAGHTVEALIRRGLFGRGVRWALWPG